jgi:hypothetical protein
MNARLKTVGDFLKALQAYPEDWPVQVATPAGGGVVAEHREIGGKPVIAIFGANGGRFGENPLTEDEYARKSREFLALWRSPGYRYTSAHGDHRIYRTGGVNDTCYGQPFDLRIVERLVKEGKLDGSVVNIERVRACQPKE